jgi:hypothetical protein
MSDLKPLSEMTNDEIKIEMAVKVMKWRLSRDGSTWLREGGVVIAEFVSGYNPDNDMKQAIEGAKHWRRERPHRRFELRYKYGKFEAYLECGPQGTPTILSESVPEFRDARALCLALIATVRKKNSPG